jgi:glycosyltransferase involved in cell wall biosynthesis
MNLRISNIRENTKILHIITGLRTGGAEMMLYKLLSRMDRAAFEAEVISLTDIGPVGKKIQNLGIPVRALGMKRRLTDLSALLKLARWIRRDPPDLIQTWMYHANLIGSLAAKLSGGIPVVWNIRRSNLDHLADKRTTIWTAKVCARLSERLPVRIVCCSEASRQAHAELGYAGHKMTVIPNGFDLAAFKPESDSKLSVCRELGISKDAPLIGLVGRFDPQKDHRNFIHAAALLNVHVPEAQFLLCGDQVTWENSKLARWIEASGIAGRFHLLGRRDDMPRLTAALDIASSSSYTEGFPNVIGEAMACGVPCVVTDVGDSALIVGNTGRVVPHKNSEALAAAWNDLIKMGPEGRKQLGLSARRRVEENYSLPAIVSKYETLYQELLSDVRH